MDKQIPAEYSVICPACASIVLTLDQEIEGRYSREEIQFVNYAYGSYLGQMAEDKRRNLRALLMDLACDLREEAKAQKKGKE